VPADNNTPAQTAGEPDMSAMTPDRPATARAADFADVVRRGYQAFNTGDIRMLHDVFGEQASWHTPGCSPIAGDHRGRTAVFAQFARYGGETEGTFKAALKQVLADDDGRVVGLHHNSGLRQGKCLDVDCCIEFQVRDGRIVSGREHFFDLHAWDAFWA
jgi:ketosteroid isomerase-like protein